MTGITIGITTRDRPRSLCCCLASISSLLGNGHDVLVFDDASATRAEEVIRGCAGAPHVQVLRDDRGVGPIEGRNRLVAQARHDVILLMDDDAAVIDGTAIARAVDLLERDDRVAAVAFAQAEADGRAWPEPMQPGRGCAPAWVPAYIGFAHLIRRSAFIAVGGYRTDLVFYGEEKDLCLRLLDAGYLVVYLPDARVAHVPDPSGRNPRRYVRQVIRNDCLSSLYNEPWLLVAAGLPVRLWRFRRMTAAIAAGDRGGFRWLLGELWRAWPSVAANRRAVSWKTMRRWRHLSRNVVPYRLATRSGTR
jgi:GT2 family glycosyltransferase